MNSDQGEVPSSASIVTSLVSDPQDLEEVFRLRYQVYGIERGFLKVEDYPEGLERDEYDDHSIHFLTRNAKGNPIATARLVLYSPIGFPIEKEYDMSQAFVGIDRRGVVEFSRFALSKNIRDIEKETAAVPASEKFGYSEIALQLIVALVREGRIRGITYCCAAVERALWLVMRHSGMGMRQVGPPKEYHGLRIPCLVSLKELLDARTFPFPPQMHALFADVMRGSNSENAAALNPDTPDIK